MPNSWGLAEFIMLMVCLILLIFGSFKGFPVF
jgi:hypothetical protein